MKADRYFIACLVVLNIVLVAMVGLDGYNRPSIPLPTILPPTEEQRAQQVSMAMKDFLLDLNTATRKELQTVPGIGDVLSVRIIAYREEIGEFSSLEQLIDVKGIGENSIKNMSMYLYVD